VAQGEASVPQKKEKEKRIPKRAWVLMTPDQRQGQTSVF
jgi:hypothetical protein